MKKLKRNFKTNLLAFILVVALIFILVNLLKLQFTGKTLLSAVDFNENKGVLISREKVVPTRGTIYDSEGNILANDVTVYKIAFILDSSHQKYAKNEEGDVVLVDDYVKDIEKTAQLVAPILGIDEDYLVERLSSEGYYQVEVGPKGSDLSYDVKLEIEALDLPGITFSASTSRYYPNNSFASHLIGYVENQNIDGEYQLVGISGIEGILNEELTGQVGYEEYYSDVNGYPLSGGNITIEPSANGYDVQLTLNSVIQQALEQALTNTMNISDSVDKAWGIVMDAKEGKILGYASYPSFDPNTMDITDYNDYNATLPYEPGSTIKSFLYAAAIDQGTFNKNDKLDATVFYVDGSSNSQIVRLNYDNGLSIHNYLDEQIPNASFYEAYCCSYNVGCAVLLEKYVDPEVYKEYMEKFGFFKSVNVYGIDEGDFYGSADYSNPYSLINTSFGQGMSANALQIIQAYTAFCNEGVMIKPYIIEQITDPNTGKVVYQGQREEVGKPISASTAAAMLDLMNGVVNSGWSITSAKYKIEQCNVGGKSGTAEVALETGGYGDLTIHSMMLAMPIEDPQVLIYFCYQDDNPYTSQSIPYINQLEQVVANVLGLSSNQSEDDESYREQFILDNYTNQSLDSVITKLSKYNLSIITIGEGDTIISQYPKQGYTVLENGRLILLTGYDNIVMADLTGFNKKEVIAYCNLANIHVKITGSGFVVSQSINPNEIVQDGAVIEVTLQ
ncbi:MAG: penicillin-binding protein [Erysipelotrichaceae bacterium]